jgi:hypothetical protein
MGYVGGSMKGLSRVTIRLNIKICVLCAALLILAACGGAKEVKEVTQESKLAQDAFSVAEALRTAYTKKDFGAIADSSTKDGYREVIDSFRHFDAVELDFTPRWVEIEKSKVYLNVAWKGAWVVGKETVRERGMAVFLFEGTPLKLSKIVRGNPFKYPEK